jgi:3'-5' exoribonuclease
MSDKTKHGAESLLARHDIMDLKAARQYLWDATEAIKDPTLKQVALQPLHYSLFWLCPAARGRHQAYPGGLAIHTAQMLMTAVAMLGPIPGARIDEVVTAATWHDYGKIFDYEDEHGGLPRAQAGQLDTAVDYGYQYTLHKETIGHLSKSFGLFEIAAAQNGLDLEKREFINHLILSHHGRLEWGSPVEPKCAEAWAFHCGDMMSSQFIKDYNG